MMTEYPQAIAQYKVISLPLSPLGGLFLWKS